MIIIFCDSPYAQEFVRIDDERKILFHSDSEGTQHTLAVGTIPLMPAYGILDLIAEFRSRCPDIHLRLEEGESKALPELLRSGTLNIPVFVSNQSGGEETANPEVRKP